MSKALVECRDENCLVKTGRASEVITTSRAASGVGPKCACRIQRTGTRGPCCRYMDRGANEWGGKAPCNAGSVAADDRKGVRTKVRWVEPWSATRACRLDLVGSHDERNAGGNASFCRSLLTSPFGVTLPAAPSMSRSRWSHRACRRRCRRRGAPSPSPAVIIRLVRNCARERVIQYSRDGSDLWRSRGVLVPAFAEDDSGEWCRHAGRN